MGEVCMIPEGLQCCLGQRQVLLRPRIDVSGAYLFWALQSPFVQHQISWNEGTGSTVSNVRIPALKALKIPRHPGNEVHIAKVLSDIAGKVELNTQANQTLEQIAQAIFKSWFVDFEPVIAKMAVLEAGGTAEQAELAAMSAISAKDEAALKQLQAEQPEAYAKLAQTAALFPSAMEESELGEIPEGWNYKPFGDLLEKTIGGDWGKEVPDTKHTEEVRILRGTDLPNVHAGNDSGVPLRYVEKKKLKTRQLQDGDIVIEVSGGSPTQPTGRSIFISQNILDRLKKPTEPASFCRLFRPLDEKIGLLLSTHLTKIYADGKTWLYQNQSTGISNFQTKVFLEKELVAVPGEKLVNTFYQQVRPLFDRMHSSENQRLANLRDALLPKLLSGDLPITNTEVA